MKATAENSQSRLTATLMAMANWRKNKSSAGEPIPDELWQRIFALEDTLPISQLRAVFNLSTNQYANKRAKLLEPKANSVTVSTDTQRQATTEFCEVKLKPEDVTSAVPKAKLSTPSPYTLEALPQAKTLIVEFRRQDGAIMKIHTTQDSIAVVMHNFFEGAA